MCAIKENESIKFVLCWLEIGVTHIYKGKIYWFFASYLLIQNFVYLHVKYFDNNSLFKSVIERDNLYAYYLPLYTNKVLIIASSHTHPHNKTQSSTRYICFEEFKSGTCKILLVFILYANNLHFSTFCHQRHLIFTLNSFHDPFPLSVI